MRQQGEPSVEEILASIKKVIARDNRETLEVERRHRVSAGVEETFEAAEPTYSDEADEVLELSEMSAQPAEPLIQSEPYQAEPDMPHFDPAPEPASDEPLLTTESAARSMRESLAALALVAEPGASPHTVRAGETSLEGLARELLRPMLAQWLDHNLPPIVERLVKAEIARIAGTRG